MNLASVGGGGGLIDSGALMGMGKALSESDMKWEPPKQPARSPAPPPSRLPSWLEGFDASTSKDPAQQPVQPDGKSTDPESGPVAEKVHQETSSLESELQTCNTIDEIRRATFHYEAAGALKKADSALGFLRLLDSGSPMPVLLEFLQDGKLNNPAARNLASLMAWRRLEKTKDEIEVLKSWIEQRIARGTLSEMEMQSLLHGLSISLRQRQQPRHARWRAWSIFKCTWAAIQASDTNGVSKLGSDTFRQLLEIASRSPDLSEGRGMGIKILKMRRSDLANLIPNISHFAFQLSETPLSRLSDGSVGPEKDWSFAWFYPLLAQIPEKYASAIIFNLSWKVTRRIVNRERNCDLMAREWFGVLTPEVFQAARQDEHWTEKWWLIDRELTSMTRPENFKTLASYLQLFEDKERYLFLLRYWVPPRWPRGDKIKIYMFSEASADTSSWKEFIRKVEITPYFPGIDRDTMLLDIVQRLHKTYLVVLQTILPDLLRLLRCLGQSSAVLKVARYLKHQSVHVEYSVWATEVTAHVNINLPLAYELFKVDTRLRFEDCPGLAESIIADPSIDTACIFQLLQRQRRTIGSVPVTSQSKQLLGITPERVSLLHNMALAFANASHLTPRQAYRSVSRCAQYFRNRLDLLRPEMSKALAVAGILRYLEAGLWVSTIRFNYVLDMVRGLEGEAVAQELDRMTFEWRETNLQAAMGDDMKEDGEEGLGGVPAKRTSAMAQALGYKDVEAIKERVMKDGGEGGKESAD